MLARALQFPVDGAQKLRWELDAVVKTVELPALRALFWPVAAGWLGRGVGVLAAVLIALAGCGPAAQPVAQLSPLQAALVLRDRGQLAEAESALQELAQSGDRAATLALAETWMLRGRHLQAVDALRPLEAETPDDPELTQLLAEALDGAGLTDEAIARYARRLRLRPDDDRAAERLTHLLADRGDFATAHDVAAAALQRHPTSGGLQVALGRALLGRGRLPQALAAAQRATQLMPKSAEAWLLLARVLLASGELDLASQALETCTVMAPGHPDALAEGAWVALRRGDAARAAELVERALAIAPDHPAALLTLAALHKQRGDWDAALVALEQAVRASRRDGRVALQAAEVALEAGETARAVTLAQLAQARFVAAKADDAELANAERMIAKAVVADVVAKAVCARRDDATVLESEVARALTAAGLSRYIAEVGRLADEARSGLRAAKARCRPAPAVPPRN